MLKFVLDTNIIISGLLWKGNESKLLKEAEQGKIRLFTTKEILTEIYQVLNYNHLQEYILQSGLTIDQLFEKTNSLCHIIIGPKLNINICRDPKDNKFLECAELAKADYIVSGDEDLLSLKKYKNIKIIKSSEALDLIKSLK